MFYSLSYHWKPGQAAQIVGGMAGVRALPRDNSKIRSKAYWSYWVITDIIYIRLSGEVARGWWQTSLTNEHRKGQEALCLLLLLLLLNTNYLHGVFAPVVGVTMKRQRKYCTNERKCGLMDLITCRWDKYVRNQKFKIDIPHINLGLLTSIVAAADPNSSCYVGYMVKGSYASFETATGVLCMRVYLRLPIGLLPLQGREQWKSSWHGNSYSQTSLQDGALRTTVALKYFW